MISHSSAHLDAFYKTFDEVKNNRYDGMIITGAPVETCLLYTSRCV